MMKYKNISSSRQTLIGFGIVEPGEVIETSEEIVNSKFELVKPKRTAKKSRAKKKGNK